MQCYTSRPITPIFLSPHATGLARGLFGSGVFMILQEIENVCELKEGNCSGNVVKDCVLLLDIGKDWRKLEIAGLLTSFLLSISGNSWKERWFEGVVRCIWSGLFESCSYNGRAVRWKPGYRDGFDFQESVIYLQSPVFKPLMFKFFFNLIFLYLLVRGVTHMWLRL